MNLLRTTRALALAGAAAFGLAVASPSTAEIVRSAQADAGIREDQPETQQGTATSTELTVRVQAGATNRASLIRFDLTGLTAASLQDFADIRISHRGNGLGNNNAGGVKFYGLNPANPLAATWNEASVMYRDAGTSGDPQPSPTNQAPAGPAGSPPSQPIIVNNPGEYNAMLTGNGVGQNANGTPGIRHETAPYSPNVNNINITRRDANNAASPAGPYANYSNQPGYTAVNPSGDFSDLITAGFDRPLSTIGNDAQDYTFLGNLNYDAKVRAGGSVLALCSGIDNSTVNFDWPVYDANRVALVNFLTTLLNNGHTSATFLIMQKNATDADPLPVRNDNLIFASKEFVAPTVGIGGSGLGGWAPILVVAPEPATLGVLGIGAIGLLRRGRR